MENGTTTYIVLKELSGNAPPHLNAAQKFLEPHTELLVTVWMFVWIMTGIMLAVKLWHEFKT